MSKKTHMNVKCPGCKKEYELTMWQSVNVDLDPTEKERIKNGTFNIVECPFCGHKAKTEYTCLYHDMKGKKQVYVLPDDFDSQLKEVNTFVTGLKTDEFGVSQLANEGYSFRAVHDFNELREKVIIWDEGLDDRAVELYKAVMYEHLTEEGNDIRKIFFLADKSGYFFELFMSDGKVGRVAIDKAMYDRFEKEYGKSIAGNTGNSRFSVIDLAWALKTLPH